MSTGRTGVWTAAGIAQGRFSEESGPIAIFNASSAIVISPLSNFMTANLNFCHLTDMALGSGLGGMVDEVPAGWTHETILVAGSDGVTRAMLAWGDALLARGQKTRTAPDADIAVSTLGYWTCVLRFRARVRRRPRRMRRPPFPRACAAAPPHAAQARAHRLLPPPPFEL